MTSGPLTGVTPYFSMNGGSLSADVAAGADIYLWVPTATGFNMRASLIERPDALASTATIQTVGGPRTAIFAVTEKADTMASTATITQPSDTVPNAFTFGAVTGAQLSTSVESNAITISGIDAPTPITIAGGGGEYAVSTNGGTTWGPYTTAAGTVSNGHMVKVRVTSSPNNSTSVSTTLTVGGVSATFQVTTLASSVTLQSLFDTVIIGAMTPESDALSVELGMKFQADAPGRITALKYLKSSLDTGTHTATLWSAGGAVLARETFTAESGSGWQTVQLTTPVDIQAGTTYIASYHSNGRYYAVPSGLSSAISKGNLTALGSSEVGGNGVYVYGSAPAFPTATFNATNYYADVVYYATGAPLPDTSPNSFSFTNQTDAAVNATVQSNAITVSGINSASPISISGTSAQYSVSTDGGTSWSAYSTTAPSTVLNGHQVRVRLTAAGTNGTSRTATLTIGGVSANFTVTTVLAAGAATWPSGWDDPRFANNVASGLLRNTGSSIITWANRTIIDDSGAETVGYGNYILRDCRIRGREGPRISGSNITIDGCLVEFYGVPPDHADGMQAYANVTGPQQRFTNIVIKNTKIVAIGSEALNAAVFLADHSGCEIIFENCWFDGLNAPNGAVCIGNSTGDVGAYTAIFRNVVIARTSVRGIRVDPPTVITEWTNVRWSDGVAIANPRP